MTIIIDGRKIKDEMLLEIKREVETLPFPPIFCDLLVGSDPSSVQYVKIKARMAESVGIKFRTAEFPEATTEELRQEVENLNKVPHMCGIIVQLPLPTTIDKKIVLDQINPELDVDCLGMINSENFYHDEATLYFPTALACLQILDSLNLDLTNKEIIILGQGLLVGQPVAHLLRKRGLSVTTINSKTLEPEILIKRADVIISAIGRAKYLKGEMLKEGVVLIDAGTSEDNGAVSGDVDLESVLGVAAYVSPTPGGVGPVTVAMLLENVLQVARRRLNKIT